MDTEVETTNPYRPPKLLGDEVRLPDPGPAFARFSRGTLLASISICVAVSTILSYAVIEVIDLEPGGLYIIAVAMITSIVFAYVTRESLLSALLCFAMIMAGDLVAIVVRDWQFADPEVMLPVSIVLSIPAAVTAALSRRWAATAEVSR